jgi:hypothetical protein
VDQEEELEQSNPGPNIQVEQETLHQLVLHKEIRRNRFILVHLMVKLEQVEVEVELVEQVEMHQVNQQEEQEEQVQQIVFQEVQ